MEIYYEKTRLFLEPKEFVGNTYYTITLGDNLYTGTYDFNILPSNQPEKVKSFLQGVKYRLEFTPTQVLWCFEETFATPSFSISLKRVDRLAYLEEEVKQLSQVREDLSKTQQELQAYKHNTTRYLRVSVHVHLGFITSKTFNYYNKNELEKTHKEDNTHLDVGNNPTKVADRVLQDLGPGWALTCGRGEWTQYLEGAYYDFQFVHLEHRVDSVIVMEHHGYEGRPRVYIIPEAYWMCNQDEQDFEEDPRKTQNSNLDPHIF